MKAKKRTEAAANSSENRWSTALLISLLTALVFIFASTPADTGVFGSQAADNTKVAQISD